MGLSVMTIIEREKLAAKYGFSSYDRLLAASQRLPTHCSREEYIAVAPDGHSFLWSQDRSVEGPCVKRLPRPHTLCAKAKALRAGS